MRRARRTATAIGIAALALGLALGGAGVWLALRDPLAALAQAERPATVQAQASERRDGRVLLRVALREPNLGDFGLLVSLPDPRPDGPLPVLLILGGLEAPEKALRQLPPAGDNAVAVFDWPLPRKIPRGAGAVEGAVRAYNQLLAAPGQIASSVAWMAAQPWADARRISLLGFSLGALAGPAAQRLSEAAGYRIGWTVFAYGGADLGALVAHHPRVRPRWLKPVLGAVASLLLCPLDPAEHLAHLSGRFLIIGGRAGDRLIPERSAELFRILAPEPKTVIRLEGEHIGMGNDQEALLAEITRLTATWLVEHGAANPP